MREQTYTDTDIEIGKLFDSLRTMRAIKEELADKEEKVTVNYKGKVLDAEVLTKSMLALDLRRFQELVDTSKPFYAEFISEIEQLPGMAKTLKYFDQFEAEARAAS